MLKIGPKLADNINSSVIGEIQKKAEISYYQNAGANLARKTASMPKWLSEMIYDVRAAIMFLTKNDAKHNAFRHGYDSVKRNIDKTI